jgi:ParB-like chromosome segregation protein Spo0J
MEINLTELKPLHPDSALIQSKLAPLRKLSTAELIESLKPGQAGALKTRPDGTMLDGHHRIFVLRERGIDVNTLPCEVILPDEFEADEL